MNIQGYFTETEAGRTKEHQEKPDPRAGVQAKPRNFSPIPHLFSQASCLLFATDAALLVIV